MTLSTQGVSKNIDINNFYHQSFCASAELHNDPHLSCTVISAVTVLTVG